MPAEPAVPAAYLQHNRFRQELPQLVFPVFHMILLLSDNIFPRGGDSCAFPGNIQHEIEHIRSIHLAAAVDVRRLFLCRRPVGRDSHGTLRNAQHKVKHICGIQRTAAVQIGEFEFVFRVSSAVLPDFSPVMVKLTTT